MQPAQAAGCAQCVVKTPRVVGHFVLGRTARHVTRDDGDIGTCMRHIVGLQKSVRLPTERLADITSEPLGGDTGYQYVHARHAYLVRSVSTTFYLPSDWNVFGVASSLCRMELQAMRVLAKAPFPFGECCDDAGEESNRVEQVPGSSDMQFGVASGSGRWRVEVVLHQQQQFAHAVLRSTPF